MKSSRGLQTEAEKMKKRKKQQASHGAITVFLAIILLPCMVFTCVFGDLSRVQLSMATAKSAGDLAVYSLLARYDEDLKEYYGLVGSCQDIEDFYDVTENYFKGMLQAEGVSGEGSALFVQYLDELRTSGYADFLRTQLSNVELTTAENGSLGDNPALIEDEIVEFMKYRGPIQIATDLVDRFSELGISQSVSEADENKQVSDKKQEYAEEQGDLLEAAFYVYLAIRQYEDAQQANNCPSSQRYTELARKLSDLRDDLKAVTSLVTKYYYPGTQNLESLIFPIFNISSYKIKKEDVGKEKKTEDGKTIYCIDNATFKKLLQDLDEDLKKVKSAGDNFVDSCKGIASPVKGVNYVVYCMKMQQVIKSSGVCTTMSREGDDLLRRYAKIQAASECEAMPDDNELPSDWQKQLEDACKKIDKVYEDYLGGSQDSAYMKKVGEYTKTADATVPKVKNRKYTFTSKLTGKEETLDSFAKAARDTIRPVSTALEEQIKRLDVVIKGGDITCNGKKKHVVSLDQLIKQAEKFTKARNDWGDAAAAYDTTYAQDEYKLYQGAVSAANGGDGGASQEEVEGEKIAAKITPESVTELKTRLVNIRADMQACLDSVTKFVYGEKAVASFESGEEMLQAAWTVVPSNQDISLEAAENAAQGYFHSLVRPAEGEIYTEPVIRGGNSGNDPDLSHDTPQLYKFLKDKLKNKTDEVEKAVDENEKKNDEYKQKGEDAKNSANSVDAACVEGKGEDLVDSHGGKKVSLLSSLKSVVDVVNDIANGSGDELRDRLYVCEYIMDMFSYSSFDNEGKYRLELEENTNVSYKDFPYASQSEAWGKEDARQVMENQSLTNRPIHHDNNHAHLGEVEYILYGNKSLDANLTESYKNIFAVREMMNVVSGFCNFYSGSNNTAKAIGGIALAVSSATAGIVPVPVTKCVLILVLSTLETAQDMKRLKQGARVEFYKSSEDDWVYSLDGESTANFSASDRSGPESGMYYSDYMYIFLLMGLNNSELYSDMLLRVGDLVQANMRHTQGNEQFQLSNTKCYFNLKATVRVEPLMLTLPIIQIVNGAEDLRDRTDWCTYKLDMIRGYS